MFFSELQLIDLGQKGEEAVVGSEVVATKTQSFVVHWEKNCCPEVEV
jgi:hypothetical protein